MNKFIVLVISFALFNSQAYSFPNVKQYPHDVVNVSGNTALSFKSNDFFNMSKTRFKGFDGYFGYCELTKYKVFVNGHDEEGECFIWLDKKDMETSYFTMEIDLDRGYKATYFYFDGGRLVFVSGNGIYNAGWQSWVKDTSKT